MSQDENDICRDALTLLLKGTDLDAHIFKHRDYCGAWAIDTSGEGSIPFHLIDKGVGWLHVADHDPQILQPGDLVFFPRDLPHIISSDGKPPSKLQINAPPAETMDGTFASILCGFYEFKTKAIKPLLDDLPDIVLLLDARNNPNVPGTALIIDAMLVELSYQLPGRVSALKDLARLLFLHLLRDRLNKGLNAGFLSAMTEPRIGNALRLIHENYSQDLTLEYLAKHVGMSRSLFSKRFRELVGMPPATYLTEWRMQKARSLLETSSLSIEQIANDCGYESDVAFRKAFKKTVGLTPGVVRGHESSAR